MLKDKKPLLLLLIISLFFVLSETVIRMANPQPVYSNLLAMLGEQYAPGACIPFTLRPGYSARQPSQEHPGRWVTVNINSLGFRGREITIKKTPGKLRILVLGDSYTFGVYVNDNETYPAVLERILKSYGVNAEVINAGYADGWSPDEHYTWLVNEGLRYQPDIVVYGFFIGNDITEIDERHWASLDENGLPNKVQNPDIYIDALGRIRSKVINEKTVVANGVYRMPLLRESHIVVFLARSCDALRRRLSQGNYRKWGEDPFPFIFKKENTIAMQQQSGLFIKVVKGMSLVAAREHAGFVVMEIPINFQVEPKLMVKVLGGQFPLARDYFAEVASLFDAAGIRYINLLDSMRKSKGAYFPRNGEVHFNSVGNRFAAEQLAGYLLESGLVMAP